MEKHCASIMIGLIDACKLSVRGLKTLAEVAAGPDTKNRGETFSRTVTIDHLQLTFCSLFARLQTDELVELRTASGRSETHCLFLT